MRGVNARAVGHCILGAIWGTYPEAKQGRVCQASEQAARSWHVNQTELGREILAVYDHMLRIACPTMTMQESFVWQARQRTGSMTEATASSLQVHLHAQETITGWGLTEEEATTYNRFSITRAEVDRHMDTLQQSANMALTRDDPDTSSQRQPTVASWTCSWFGRCSEIDPMQT